MHNSTPANLRLKVDTCAQGNILPMRTFIKMYPNPINRPMLEKNNIRLSVYNGKVIEQYGKFDLTLQYDSRSTQATFYVVDTPGPVLLGLSSCNELKLVTLHCSVSKSE